MSKEEVKSKVEALLFASSKGLSIREIAEKLKLKEEEISEALEELKEKYSDSGSIEIVEELGIWKMRVKPRIAKYLKGIVKPEIPKSILETLAYIAYKNPIKQSEVVKFRGNKAYKHIKDLVEMGFISSRKFGRTLLLELTPKFYEYFDIKSGEEKYLFREVDIKKEGEGHA